MTILADYPAYKIVSVPENKAWTYGEQFALPFNTRNHGTLWRHYTFGSVVGYALSYRECPIKAIDRARSNGHDLHWVNANAVVLSSTPEPQRTVIGLNFGDFVKFEGRTFRLDRAPNDNVRLFEIV